jgi:hypothetical protein
MKFNFQKNNFNIEIEYTDQLVEQIKTRYSLSTAPTKDEIKKYLIQEIEAAIANAQSTIKE